MAAGMDPTDQEAARDFLLLRPYLVLVLVSWRLVALDGGSEAGNRTLPCQTQCPPFTRARWMTYWSSRFPASARKTSRCTRTSWKNERAYPPLPNFRCSGHFVIRRPSAHIIRFCGSCALASTACRSETSPRRTIRTDLKK